MTVSVIIPVYNVLPYLKRCVESVLRQTFKDIEVIIVDDGSTDGSGELCDELAASDRRIIIIHQENQGLSVARNSGILKATGDYIMFLDADDAWILDNGLATLVDQCKSACDLVVFKNVDYWWDGHITYSKDYDVELLNHLTDAHAIFLHLVETRSLRISACFTLIRRQIITDHNIFFYKGMISEDLTWSLLVWQHIQRVTFVNLDFYGYYHRNDSITNTIANTLYAYQCYDKIFSYWEKECDHGCVNANAIRIFLADMWVSKGYCYHKLQASEKSEALAILKRHIRILKYAETPKARRAACLSSVIGAKSTIFVLGVYWRLRTVVVRHK